MAKVFGRATLKLDGKVLDSMKGATLDVGGTKRTSKTTTKRVHFSEELMPAKVECSVPLDGTFSLQEIAKIEAATLIFETDMGKSYTVRNAFLTDPPSTGDQDGEVKLMFEGDPAEES